MNHILKYLLNQCWRNMLRETLINKLVNCNIRFLQLCIVQVRDGNFSRPPFLSWETDPSRHPGHGIWTHCRNQIWEKLHQDFTLKIPKCAANLLMLWKKNSVHNSYNSWKHLFGLFVDAITLGRQMDPSFAEKIVPKWSLDQDNLYEWTANRGY